MQKTIVRMLSLCVVATGLALCPAPAAAGGTVTVTVAGTSYTLTTVQTSYAEHSAVFQAQPWWGNEPLAAAISGQLQYQLGDLEGGPGVIPGIPSALLAYGTSTSFTSITYWDGAVVNCPTGCPMQNQTFFYVQLASIATVPTLSEWTLPVVSLLLALGGIVALRRA